jgi:hypothetical protein
MGEQFPAVLCTSVPVSKRGTQREQTFQYPRINIISWTAWCPNPCCAALSPPLILRSYLMSHSTFCLLALSCSSFRSTTARLIGDVRVSALKMFHPPSDTLAPTHTGISIHTTKLLVDDCCRVSLFHKKFKDSTLTKRHIVTAIFS